MSDDNNVSTKKQDIHDDNQQEKLVPELRFKKYFDNWKEYKIGEICDVIGGGTPKTDIKSYWNGNIDWYTPSEVGKSKYVIGSDRKISLDGLNNSSAKLLPKNTILLSSRATIGETGILLKESTTNQGFQSLIPKDNVNYEFLYYLVNIFKKELIRKASGSTFLEISKNEINKIKVNIPQINEQKDIANFISLIDEKIELLEKKSNLIKKYKHGVIQKLRKGKIRFKKDNKEDYKNWKEVKLNEVLFEHKLRYTGKEEVYSVSVHKGVVNQVEHLGRSFATKNLSKYKLVKPGDLIYTKSPTAGFELGIIKQNKNNKDVVVSPLYGVFTPKSKYLGNYLDAYFESSVNTRNYLHPIVQKGAKNTMNITNKVFLSKTLYLPSDLEEQKKISNFIDIINQKSEKINKDLLNMKQFKKGLLQKMFV